MTQQAMTTNDAYLYARRVFKAAGTPSNIKYSVLESGMAAEGYSHEDVKKWISAWGAGRRYPRQ